MMYENPTGATLIDKDEASGLIPQHIVTQDQLNKWEQANILEAEGWISGKKFNLDKIAGIEFLKKLHWRMFNKTWRWAGQFRKSNKNIGVDWYSISVNLSVLFDDLKYQVMNDIYQHDEIAARFHHRVVAIHPFSNGNGRHARMMTDILLLSQNQPRFSWGRVVGLNKISPVRDKYIEALRAADKKDYSKLLEFIRS